MSLVELVDEYRRRLEAVEAAVGDEEFETSDAALAAVIEEMVAAPARTPEAMAAKATMLLSEQGIRVMPGEDAQSEHALARSLADDVMRMHQKESN